jgi:hypothetical protein
MEWLDVEVAFGPFGKAAHYVSLASVFLSGARAVRGLWELVFESLIGAHTHEKNSPTVLRDAIVLRIQHRPFHPIAGRAISD